MILIAALSCEGFSGAGYAPRLVADERDESEIKAGISNRWQKKEAARTFYRCHKRAESGGRGKQSPRKVVCSDPSRLGTYVKRQLILSLLTPVSRSDDLFISRASVLQRSSLISARPELPS